MSSFIIQDNIINQAKIDPFRGYIERRKRIIEPHSGNIEPRKRINAPFRENIKQLPHCGYINQPLIQPKHEIICVINKRIPVLNRTRLSYEDIPSLLSQKTTKTVIDKYQYSFRDVDKYHLDISVVRNVHTKHVKPRVRDREPSRIPVKKFL